MKLSTKGRYGVRLMLDLALHAGQGPVLLKDIAARQEISEKYLWQLVPPLKNAGFVSTKRGMHGGYALNKDPAKISIKDIVDVLEGPISLVGCTNNKEFCKRMDKCFTRDIWCEITHKVSDIFAAYTLADLVERYSNHRQQFTYSI